MTTVTYKGEKMSLSEAVRRSGAVISIETVRSRLDRGWPLERVLSLPVRAYQNDGRRSDWLKPPREWPKL